MIGSKPPHFLPEGQRNSVMSMDCLLYPSILEFLFDNADKFESGLVFCILTGAEIAVGLDDVFPN